MAPYRSAQAVAISNNGQAPMPTADNASPEQISRISEIFLALPKYISVVPHPSQSNTAAIRLQFISNLNVAPAVASFLNQEFYKTPRLQGRVDPFAPNGFAFVAENEKEQYLFVTVHGELNAFIDRLQPFANTIQDTVKNPGARLYPELTGEPNPQSTLLALPTL
jgi:hypothetical protein